MTCIQKNEVTRFLTTLIRSGIFDDYEHRVKNQDLAKSLAPAGFEYRQRFTILNENEDGYLVTANEMFHFIRNEIETIEI